MQKKDENQLTKLFPGFSEEEILKVINNLNESRKTLLELQYGLNGREKTKIKDIAIITGDKYTRITSKTNYVLKVVQKQLNDLRKSSEKDNSKQEYKRFVSTLSDPLHQIILSLRLGLIKDRMFNEEEIATILSMNVEDVRDIIKFTVIKNVPLEDLSEDTIEKLKNRTLIKK